MKKHILEQYSAMQNEKKDLIERINSLNQKILNMEVNDIVSDTVIRGRHGRKPVGVIRIEGFPSREYTRRKHALQQLKEKLERKVAELLELTNEVEQYIDGISDSRIRQIMRYRYMDDMTWIQVARQMHETEDSARKALERFLAEEEMIK